MKIVVTKADGTTAEVFVDRSTSISDVCTHIETNHGVSIDEQVWTVCGASSSKTTADGSGGALQAVSEPRSPRKPPGEAPKERRRSSLNRHNTPAVKDLRDLKRAGEADEFASPLIEESMTIAEGGEEAEEEETTGGETAAAAPVDGEVPARRKSSLLRHNTPAPQELRDLKRAGEANEFASPLIEESMTIAEGGDEEEEEEEEEQPAQDGAAGSAVQAARSLRTEQ